MIGFVSVVFIFCKQSTKRGIKESICDILVSNFSCCIPKMKQIGLWTMDIFSYNVMFHSFFFVHIFYVIRCIKASSKLMHNRNPYIKTNNCAELALIEQSRQSFLNQIVGGTIDLIFKKHFRKWIWISFENRFGVCYN